MYAYSRRWIKQVLKVSCTRLNLAQEHLPGLVKGPGINFAVAPFFQRADCKTAASVKHLAYKKHDVMQEGNESCLHIRQRSVWLATCIISA